MIHKNQKYIFFALPAVLIFFFIIILPVFSTLLFSFIEWTRYLPGRFGTLIHYKRAIGDLTLRKAFINNFLYIFFTIFLEAGFGLLLAGIVNNMKQHSIIYRSILFAPIVLPPIVVGVLWHQVFSVQSGLLNAILGVFGVMPVSWLSPPYTILSISIVSGWLYAGYFMTIFYSGLSRIPESIIESARIEGASSVQIYFRIEIPLIKNLIVLAFLMVTTGGFKAYDLFKIMLQRDPMESGIILPTMLVRVFFENQDIGYGSAISIILTGVVVLFVVIIQVVNKRVIGLVEEY